VSAQATIQIENCLDGGAPDTLADDVREGLSAERKRLPPKYFYDARGSELFDRITSVPEYYPTRSERAILNRRAPDLVEGMRELVELGSGTASKTRALLYAMAAAGTLDLYVPFDVDESVVKASADELAELYPGLAVHGVVGDFECDLGAIPEGERRLFAFLGGTVGNFEPDQRARFLARVRGLLGPTDRLILGTDLVKDTAMLEAAYDDAGGVTAEFNLNVLRVLNTELEADFDLDAFEHVAVFVDEHERIEMRLRSLRDQTVSIPGAQITAHFAEGEEMLTEISSKFTPQRIAQELTAAGLSLDELITDEQGLFAVSVATPA
jgi:L-histidine N-alpha-methyltransferase